jgi:uncharacterized protein (TIGR00288 family)
VAELFRIALLIDADNADPSSIATILDELAQHGDCTVRRAYGNWFKPQLKGWQTVLRSNTIRPVQQFDPTKGKNATDMALAIDAVELLHTVDLESFAIVSSDADFTPVVQYLREKGKQVHGFGKETTPAAFRSACTRFTVLTKAQPKADETVSASDDLVASLAKVVQRHAGKDGWARVSAVGQSMRRERGADPKSLGHATWTKALKAHGYELRNEGSTSVSVRDPRASRG